MGGLYVVFIFTRHLMLVIRPEDVKVRFYYLYICLEVS